MTADVRLKEKSCPLCGGQGGRGNLGAARCWCLKSFELLTGMGPQPRVAVTREEANASFSGLFRDRQPKP